MKKIYKYIMLPNTCIGIHSGYKILSIKTQKEDVVMYAMVDTTEPLETLSLTFIPTGGDIDDTNLEFIDTVQLTNGLVFHVFKNK